MSFSAKSYRSLALIIPTVVFGLLLSSPVLGQKISFNLWTGSDDISIFPIGSPDLNFTQKKSVIIQGSTVTIDLLDDEAIVFEIKAPENFDVTVDVSAPINLYLSSDPSETIPFAIGIAYNNQNPENHITDKQHAVQLPIGFSTITFPINRRTTDAPGPPPTPLSGTATRNKVIAYLYLYGTLGPVGTVPAGTYRGDISITVNITSHD